MILNVKKISGHGEHTISGLKPMMLIYNSILNYKFRINHSKIHITLLYY